MNTKKDSYLNERKYIKSKEINESKLTYWKDILGENVANILREDQSFLGYVSEEQYEVEKNVYKNKMHKDCLQLSDQEKEILVERLQSNPEYLFQTFYVPIIESAAAELQNRTKGLYCFRTEIVFDFAEVLYQNLQSICMRTLIMSMHWAKEEGLLSGENSKEEYLFFCREIMSEPEFTNKLLEEYPVLHRCICETVGQRTDFFVRVIEHYAQDEEQFRQYGAVEITSGEMPVIETVKANFSDTHRKGQQVLKMKLSNGQWIFYKPRAMDNEAVYFELLRWLEQETGIEQKKYLFYSADNHSWSAVVEKADCHSEAELKEYYRRLGVLLFLAYILGTKDLHSENLIASGAYPVLVDLETLVNLPAGRKENTAEEEVLSRLSNSVLYTGLLPFYLWGKDGKGVNCSAISGVENQMYPFKLPVISDPGTSDMKIVYRHPRTEKGENLVLLNGEFRCPNLYQTELVEGYQKCYRAVLEKKEAFLKKIERISSSTSRYLVADTQRYTMQLTGSYHPELLTDGAEREIYLHIMWHGREYGDEKTKQLVNCEIKELLRGDIPYFTYSLNDTSLYSADGTRIKDYFDEPSIAKVVRGIRGLNPEDMERQSGLIQIALELLPGNGSRLKNGIYRHEVMRGTQRKPVTANDKENALHKVTDEIMRAAVYNKEHTDVCWYGISLYSSGEYGWRIRPMNMYFYEGIAGMAVLFHKIHTLDKREETGRLVSILDEKLFSYTESCWLGKSKCHSSLTGMYEGEASVLYAYLNIYRIEKDRRYLGYAEKHSEVLEELLEGDKVYDLLSGNAGAANVLIQLYEFTENKRYLDTAQKAIRVLERAAVRQERGIGWITENGIRPMAGMAHGNSGILIPFVKLWKYTGENRYMDSAEKILAYENSLYDENIENWMDVRAEASRSSVKDECGAVAWCHGAAGILMSRRICLEYVMGTKLEKTVERDIEKAFAKVWRYPVRDSWSLCHGTCGNMMILGRKDNVKDLEDYLVSSILQEEMKMLPQEKISYGMMNGWGGIAYTLCKIR